MRPYRDKRLQLPGTPYGVDGSNREPLAFEDGDFKYVNAAAYSGDLYGIIDQIERDEDALGLAESWGYIDGLRIKDKESAEIQKQVDEYLASGGTITVCKIGQTSGVFDGD